MTDQHLVSDAPLGVFLSGGIDSSALAGLAARGTDRLRTVSVVFDEPSYSEERYMRLVAERIRSDHVSVPLRAPDLLEWSDDAFMGMDQPTVEGINSYVVSRAAAGTGLKVALSGVGADELFDGYGYARRMRALEASRRLPRAVNAVAWRSVGVLQDERRAGKERAWLSGGLPPGGSYRLLRRTFLPDHAALLPGRPSPNGHEPPLVDVRGDLRLQASTLDLGHYTKNMLLRDTDAMGMSQSLEVRVPFLDHELVEWVLRVPSQVKGAGRKGLLAARMGGLGGGKGLLAGGQKGLLVSAVADLLPPEVWQRRKQGFLLPLAQWMRRELRGEVEKTLREPPAAVADVLDRDAMLAVWRDFLDGSHWWLRAWALYALCRWSAGVTARPA